MDKPLLRNAHNYAKPVYQDARITEGAEIEKAFIAGAKYQAKADSSVVNYLAQSHSKGGFSELGFNIARAILQSVGIE